MDFDTDAGLAGYGLHHPISLDFEMMERVAYDTGYTLMGVELEIDGEVTQGDCATCGHEVSFLRIPETQQTFELDGELEPGSRRIRAIARDWGTPHMRLEVQPDPIPESPPGADLE